MKKRVKLREIDFAEYFKSKELKENQSLIESSLYSGLATFGDEDLYPTLGDKISMY